MSDLPRVECSGAMRGNTCMACGYERPARSDVVVSEGALEAFDLAGQIEARAGLRAEVIKEPRKVWEGFAGSIIAADHDKPLPQLHDLGTGEFYARRTGRAFTMPPSLGDFNDMMQSDGLRAVALRLNEIKPGGL